jgi:2-iminobutanoate/2-iminopropanoate deaminase
MTNYLHNKTSAINPLRVLTDPVRRAILPKNIMPAGNQSLAGEKTGAMAFIIGSTLQDGVKSAFSSLSKDLGEKGLSLSNVDIVMVTLRSMDLFKDFNGSYEAELGGHKPARYCVEKPGILPNNAFGIIRVVASDGAKTPINPESLPAPVGPFSYGICTDGKIYVSGQIAPGEPEFGKQAETTIGKMETVLKAGGFSMKEVTEATIFFLDKEKLDAHMLKIQRHFPNWYSQDNIFKQVSALPLGVDFEVSCVAEREGKR